MKGGMMRSPLTVPALLERAATLFGDKEVVTADAECGVVRHRWRDVAVRAWALADALPSLGVTHGSRVASLAWSGHRHLELYFGVPAAGAVLLTVNVRLSPDQIARILEHAGAEVVFADPEFVGLVDTVAGVLPRLRRRVVLAEEAHPGWDAYESLLAGGSTVAPGVPLDEDEAAGLCYTSGTTGEPKGVLYSHRALALHTLAICLPDGFGLGERDTILPAVPMFHANAWGLAHAAAMTGAKLVLPGARPSAERLAGLLSTERVTFAAGVPTVWMGVLDVLRRRRTDLAPGLRIHSGGAPTAPALLEAYRKELGIEILTGWGMTELTPVGMVTHPRGAMEAWSAEDLLPVRTSQGTPLPFVEARVVDSGGAPTPHDGTTPGELEVRGPWVCAGVFPGRRDRQPPRRVAADGGRRHRGPARIRPPGGPHEGPDPQRRRVDLQRPARARAHGPSVGGGGGRGRGSRSAVAGETLGVRRPAGTRCRARKSCSSRWRGASRGGGSPTGWSSWTRSPGPPRGSSTRGRCASGSGGWPTSR